MPGDRRNILVVGPSWVGDMVMSQVLYIYLQQSRPGVEIDVLAPEWSEPLLRRMPEVRSPITMPLGHGELGLSRRRHIGRALRARAYDQALVLPNSWKSALIPYFAGIPRRTGWRGEQRYGLLNDLRALDERALPLMAQRFLALGQAPDERPTQPLPIPRLVVDREKAEAVLARLQLSLDRPLLALCPGAEFGSAKRWPAAYYAELAAHYLGQGWQVALLGSHNDRLVTRDIHERCDKHNSCFDLAGRTQLAEAVDLLSRASAVVSNDSGLMHIAAALNRHLVAIYGATSPAFTPPMSERASTIVSDIDCAPCFARECPLGHHGCMQNLSVRSVVQQLDALLETGG